MEYYCAAICQWIERKCGPVCSCPTRAKEYSSRIIVEDDFKFIITGPEAPEGGLIVGRIN